MYRILIVEDDPGIARAIEEQANQWGWEAACVKDFRNVMAEFAAYNPHLVLLDISPPFFNGYHWCQEIRRVSKMPVLFISSASNNMNMGADDFIAKPFDQSVLIAKIQTMLRRTYDFGGAVPILEHRGALLNIGDNTLTYQGQQISLTKNKRASGIGLYLCRRICQNLGHSISAESTLGQGTVIRICLEQNGWKPSRITGAFWKQLCYATL